MPDAARACVGRQTVACAAKQIALGRRRRRAIGDFVGCGGGCVGKRLQLHKGGLRDGGFVAGTSWPHATHAKSSLCAAAAAPPARQERYSARDVGGPQAQCHPDHDPDQDNHRNSWRSIILSRYANTPGARREKGSSIDHQAPTQTISDILPAAARFGTCPFRYPESNGLRGLLAGEYLTPQSNKLARAS